LSGQIGASPNIPVSNLGVGNENAQYTGERITDNKDTEGNQRV
jgi:hypothetical protein